MDKKAKEVLSELELNPNLSGVSELSEFLADLTLQVNEVNAYLKKFNELTGMTVEELKNKLVNGDLHIVDSHKMGSVSDGSHTFDDLYYHRMLLFSLLCKRESSAWRSKLHDDGTMFEGYFIVGIATPDGQFTYHYKLEYWDEFNGITTLEYAPVWDGHTAEDITRLKSLGDEDEVTISKSEHDTLIEFRNQLEHLENNGVDNWSGYSWYKDDGEEDDE